MPGEEGICRTRLNHGGRLMNRYHGVISALHSDPIEKKPLYHFHPGRPILSVGGLGCNLSCDFCQNHHISQEAEAHAHSYAVRDASDLAEKASLYPGNIGLAYTYNEPIVNYEFVLQCAEKVKQRELCNVMVSNGYIQQAPLDAMLEVMDAFNIDLKGFSEDFYRVRTKARLEPVLKSIARIAHSGRHLELSFLLIPRCNDDPEEWEALLRWIADHCGDDCVLHLSRYSPRYQLDLPSPTTRQMEDMLEVAQKHLKHVYPGNNPDLAADTHCPSCNSLLIHRKGYQVSIPGLDDHGRCSTCKHPLNIAIKTLT